jgi:hypothetical protein
MSWLTRERGLWIASAIGYGIGIAALVTAIANDGGLAYDARSYWLAGQHVLSGDGLYTTDPLGAAGLYPYPPLFAQLWAPLSILPELAFAWIWRLVCVGCLRYLAGSWRNVGLWLLVPLTITELSAANVTFPLAAAAMASLSGHAWLAAWAGALKLGGFLLLPYIWFAKPEARRSALIGLGSAAAAVLVSVALSSRDWVDFAAFVTRHSVAATAADGLVRLGPTGGADLLLRVILGIVVVIVAIRIRSDRLAYAAAVVTIPVLWWQRLVPLLATPRLPGRPEPEPRLASTAP